MLADSLNLPKYLADSLNLPWKSKVRFKVKSKETSELARLHAADGGAVS
jgi:hypothetical protein